MRDYFGAEVFMLEIFSKGAEDILLSNGIIVAEDAVKVSRFYVISKEKKVW